MEVMRFPVMFGREGRARTRARGLVELISTAIVI